jgi:K+/H+ antiporter YhaU regulatory subunit KhtT
MGRAFSRKGEQGGLVEESGADFFLGVLVTEGSPVAGLSIQAAGALAFWLSCFLAFLLATACACQPARLLSSPRSSSTGVRAPALFYSLLPQLALRCNWLTQAVSSHSSYAGLRNLDGQYVTSVRRGSELVHAVGPEFMLATGDVLYLSGEESRKEQSPFSVGASICWAGGSSLDTSAVSPSGLFDHLTKAKRCPASWSGPALTVPAGIPDGTEKLTQLGLVPFTDALEEVGEADLPGLSATFGVKSISVPRVGSFKTASSSGELAHPPPELVEATIKKGGCAWLYQRVCSRRQHTQRYYANSSSSADQSLAPSLASLPAGSEIVGKSIRAAAFRSRFHAAVISIKRNGIPINWSSSQIGDEILRAEDRLLLDVAPQFWTEPEVNDAFTDLTKGGQVTHRQACRSKGSKVPECAGQAWPATSRLARSKQAGSLDDS